MDTRAKDLCHCGSGRRYKRCHMEADQSRRRLKQLVIFAVPVLLVSAGLYFWSQRDRGPGAGGVEAGSFQTGASASADQSPLPDGRQPQPWEFDETKNRYWDPNHNHWHDGPAPSEAQRSANAGLPDSREFNPNYPNPEPWQYDENTNQFFHPGHNHWHAGQPPAEGQRAAALQQTESTTQTNPNIPNPEPWQYDPVANQYYHPTHNHWHAGQPPPPESRNNSVTTTTTPGGLQTQTSTVNIQPTGGANPNIPNPEPWQYDPETDQHYHPEHGHWHRGQPPTNLPDGN